MNEPLRDFAGIPAGSGVVLRFVRGDPTAEEVAALTAVLARTGAESASSPRPRRGGWADPAHRMRRYPRPEWGGWAASARW